MLQRFKHSTSFNSCQVQSAEPRTEGAVSMLSFLLQPKTKQRLSPFPAGISALQFRDFCKEWTLHTRLLWQTVREGAGSSSPAAAVMLCYKGTARPSVSSEINFWVFQCLNETNKAALARYETVTSWHGREQSVDWTVFTAWEYWLELFTSTTRLLLNAGNYLPGYVTSHIFHS